MLSQFHEWSCDPETDQKYIKGFLMSATFKPDIPLIKQILKGKHQLEENLVDRLVESRLSIAAFVYFGEFDLDTMILKALIDYFGIKVEIYESDEPLMSPTGKLPFLIFSDGTCVCDMQNMLRVLEICSQIKLDVHEKESFKVLDRVLRPVVIKAVSSTDILWKYVQRYPWYLSYVLYFGLRLESRKIKTLRDISMCLAPLKESSVFICAVIDCYEHVMRMLPSDHPLCSAITFVG